jgi:hypothetical protein
MGTQSEPADKGKSDIDRELETAALQAKLKFKVLLLGSGESGKSTVLKQLKLVNRINLTPQEIKDYTYSLKRNALESMIVLVEKTREYGMELESSDLKAKAQALETLGKTALDEEITMQIADSITALWNSEVIKKVYERRNEFWLLDSADYYFNRIATFVQDDFEPQEDDMIMVSHT